MYSVNCALLTSDGTQALYKIVPAIKAPNKNKNPPSKNSKSLRRSVDDLLLQKENTFCNVGA